MRKLKPAMEAFDETPVTTEFDIPTDFEASYLQQASDAVDTPSVELNEALEVVEDLKMLSDEKLTLDDATALDAENGTTVGMESYTAAYDPARRYQVAMESALDKVKEVGKRVLDAIVAFLKKFAAWILNFVTKLKSYFSGGPKRDMDKLVANAAIVDRLLSSDGRREAGKFVEGLPQNLRGLMDYQGCEKYYKGVKDAVFTFKYLDLVDSSLNVVDINKEPESRTEFLEEVATRTNKNIDDFNDYREEVSASKLRSWVSSPDRTAILLSKVFKAFDLADDPKTLVVFDETATKCKELSKKLESVSKQLYSEQESTSKEDDFENVQGERSKLVSQKLQLVREAGNVIRAVAKACGTLAGTQTALYSLISKFYQHIDALLAKLENKKFAILFSSEGIGKYDKEKVKEARAEFREASEKINAFKASKGL